MTAAISFEHVSKQYRLGEVGTRTLSRDIERTWAKLRGNPDPFAKIGVANERERSGGEYVWALKDVSFDVAKGEVIGIIGRNGAGKSTLLKLLSRVTAPTTGRIKAKGRIASLLEVGTGFHPELTGRENIYLNGAILGMSRSEISRKLDEIVEFSGCSKYVDTPVKRYSSGMIVRLGFSVAAHLECEVLIVDEVLAVGDAAFQKQCIGKMGDLSGSGRTILLVSHNMGVIKSLCSRAVCLSNGEVEDAGEPDRVVREYLLAAASGDAPGQVSLSNHSGRIARMTPVLREIRLRNHIGEITSQFQQGDPIHIEIAYDASTQSLPLAGMGFILTAVTGARVGSFNSYMFDSPPHSIPTSSTACFRLNSPALTPGSYYLTVSVGPHQSGLLDKVVDAIRFDVESSDQYGTGYLLTSEDGVVALDCEFCKCVAG